MKTFKVGTPTCPHLSVAMKILSYDRMLAQKKGSAVYIAAHILSYAQCSNSLIGNSLFL